MSRTLYVHVGPRKTATSAIQATLAKHDNSVVIYPRVGQWGPGSHHGLVFKFFAEERPKKRAEGNIIEMFESISSATKDNNRNVVISSEALESLDVGAFIRALLPYIGGSETNVEILFTCREHFSRAASWYNHRLRSKKSDEWRTPDKFLEESGRGVCYARLAQSLRDTGFKVTALNYHPSENWVRRFMMHIGFPEHQVPIIENKLISFSPKALIVNLALKEITKSKDESLKYMKSFRKMPGTRTPSKFIFGQEVAARADRHFGVDRQFLVDEFGICLVPPDLNAQENGLFINGADFADIAAVAETLGNDGQKIMSFARQYLRA